MRSHPLFANPHGAYSDEVVALRELKPLFIKIEHVGMTCSCESANDLGQIATNMGLFGVSNRDAVLLRYYAERIELENGAATKIDNAVAKALLAWHDGESAVTTVEKLRAILADARKGVR